MTDYGNLNFNNFKNFNAFGIGNMSLPALSFGSSPSVSPADFGMGLFNMPVMSFGGAMDSFSSKQDDYSKMLADAFEKQKEFYNKAFDLSRFKLNTIQTATQDTDNNPVIDDYKDEDTSYFNYDAKELKEKWSAKKTDLSDEFYKKVVKIAENLNCDPNDLMAVMNAESGIKANAVNKNGGATGLIQFMPKTAKGLGVSTSQLAQMSPEKQLKYVEKYLKGMKKAAGLKKDDKIGAGTLYALIFLPARANRDVLASKNESNMYYSANKGLDINKDGKITKDELGKRVQNFMA